MSACRFRQPGIPCRSVVRMSCTPVDWQLEGYSCIRYVVQSPSVPMSAYPVTLLAIPSMGVCDHRRSRPRHRAHRI